MLLISLCDQFVQDFRVPNHSFIPFVYLLIVISWVMNVISIFLSQSKQGYATIVPLCVPPRGMRTQN